MINKKIYKINFKNKTIMQFKNKLLKFKINKLINWKNIIN